MKNDLQAGLQNIIDAINNLIEPKLGSLRYDKTFRGKVISDEGNNVYGVQINGKNYKAVYTGEKIPVGQIVKVKAPLNNFSDIYIETLPGSGSGSAGNYNDLLNKPILNTNNTGTQVPSATETIQGTISLHKVSKTGNYNDLLNKPTLDFIPTSEKGATNGVAGLDENKKVSKSNLPTDTVYDNNYVHTDNNFTTAMKNKLDSVEEGAEPNKIEIIQRNGSVLPINNKIVNVEVPTKTSDLTNDNGFISSIPVASDTILGGIKVGENLSITADGVLSAKGGGTTDYSVLLNKPVLNTANTKSLAVDSNETINGVVSLHKISKTGSYEDLLNKPTIPTKTSDLENDSGFITNTVGNLTNYYLKSETYTQSEVNNLIGQIKTISIEVVNTLPTTGEDNKIYLVPKEGSTGDVYNEYIWVNNTWELIGSTQVDLTGYATQDWVNNQIKDFLNESQVTQIVNNSLTNYYTKTETYSKTEVNNLLNGKANADDIPTKTSDLTNDSGFIDNSVDNLENYYKKSETYNQTEINNLLSNKADISDIPTKTGDLTNNGDGTTGSKYITNSDLNTELESKQDKITGGATTIVTNDLTVNRALVSNANGKVAVSNITSTELGYLSGARSNLQSQIDTITTEGGQPNVIEVVQENGVPLEITNKTVNVTVPTKVSELENDKNYLTEIPVASSTTLGGIKVGDNLSITDDGTLSAQAGTTIKNLVDGTGEGALKQIDATEASGKDSFAEGANTWAVSNYSHTEGLFTVAGRKAFTIVSGDSSSKTYTLDSVAGLTTGMLYSIKRGNTTSYNVSKIESKDTTTKTITVTIYKELSENENYLFVKDKPNVGTICIPAGNGSHAEGSGTYAIGQYSHAEGINTRALGDQSHVEGNETMASGNCSHAEGYNTTASGNYSHAEGSLTKASSSYSHAEGSSTKASSSYSHAEGFETLVQGQAGHAEGGSTKAMGYYSHAEGQATVCYGHGSHAEGTYTQANADGQHAQGKYNIIDTAKQYAHIVGNGTADDARSNAHTLDWNGNSWFAGEVYVGSTSGTNKDSGSVKLAKITDIPTKTSDLTNDSGFIDNSANNLTNYYNKTETYTQTQVNNLLDNNKKEQIKTAVYINEFTNVSTSTNVAFKTMFPNLSLDKVVCFNIEIVNVYETWDRVYAHILRQAEAPTSGRSGELQIRSYASTQNVVVRVTAFYRE